MKAMIFAAGLGSRLSALTQNTPKALVKINGIPLLEIVIKKLVSSGFDDLIINVHHFADRIEEFIRNRKDFDAKISFSDERRQLLETGGGLKHASWFFDNSAPFLVHNVDVISNIDLRSLLSDHIRSEALATLAVRTRKSSRQLYFNDHKLLCGWKDSKTGKSNTVLEDSSAKPFGFSGIQVINPEIFKLMDEEGKFGIIDVYLRLAQKYLVRSFVHEEGFWIDVGSPENLALAEKYLN
ncbi:MAG: nucleotidyltransferase family protein [Bacteroidetes bacterium]|nr:nucleotidyltransferase family protein [Bacteroidota bacterium]